MSSIPDARYTDRIGEGLAEAQLYELAKTYAGRMAQGADVGPLRDMPDAELVQNVHPDYDFLQQTWPYGFTSANVVPLFKGAIGVPVEGDPVEPLEALIKRLGFYPHQREQARKALEVAFHTFLAVHLLSSGDINWQATFDSFRSASLATAISILDAHPLFHNLMHPPSSFFADLADVLKRNRHMPDEKDMATVMKDIGRRGEAIHETFIEKALSTAIEIQYTTASQTWLSIECQQGATHRSQWELLIGMTRIKEVDFTAVDRQERGQAPLVEESWLRSYELLLATQSVAANVVLVKEASVRQLKRIHQSHLELSGATVAGTKRRKIVTHAAVPIDG